MFSHPAQTTLREAVKDHLLCDMYVQVKLPIEIWFSVDIITIGFAGIEFLSYIRHRKCINFLTIEFHFWYFSCCCQDLETLPANNQNCTLNTREKQDSWEENTVL